VGDEAGELYVDGLNSDVSLVRFTSAMAIASTEYAPALETLQELIVEEDDYRVRSGFIYALHRLGDDTEMRELMSAIMRSCISPTSRLSSMMTG